MKNIGGSLLASSEPRILVPIKTPFGTLQVVPDEQRDTHDLILETQYGRTVIASHPNGYSCHILAERMVSGVEERIANQAAYIARCGGESIPASGIMAAIKATP